MMNVFGIELDDWHEITFNNVRGTFFRCIPGSSFSSISLYKENELFVIHFYNELYFLEKYLPLTIIRGNAEYAKQYVDDFLIKMDKMKAFI